MIGDSFQALFDRIQPAFAHVTPPSAENLVLATRDDEGTEEYFSGKRFDEIPDEAFVKYCTAVWFFNTDAFLYYLPGFMKAALRGADNYGVIWGHIYAQLNDRQRRPDVLAMLNDEQRSCIVDFFRCCDASPEDLKRLERAFLE